MSAREADFLHEWLNLHVPEMMATDAVSIDDLTNKLVAACHAAGVTRDDIEEDTENLYQAIFDWIVQHQDDRPD